MPTPPTPGTSTTGPPGLGEGFERDGETWTFRDPGGNAVRMHFTPPNEFGVLDHDVLVDPPVHNAMRAAPNGDGAEVTFLLLQLPGMTDAEFERDAATVRRDLEMLKGILERG